MADEPRNFYAEDSLESVYNELRELEIQLADSALTIRFKNEKAARDRSAYEKFKNDKLIELFAEESRSVDPVKKRTEQQRESIYRSIYSEERLQAMLSEHELKAEKDYLDIVKAQLMSVQTRAKMITTER